MITWPSSGIVHIVNTVELLVELGTRLPLRRNIDEPRPARNANTRATTKTTATVSFFTSRRVSSWGVKFYSRERCGSFATPQPGIGMTSENLDSETTRSYGDSCGCASADSSLRGASGWLTWAWSRSSVENLSPQRQTETESTSTILPSLRSLDVTLRNGS